MERPVDSLSRGPRHHFFGYYDGCPCGSTGRYVLGLETGFVGRAPGPEDRAVVGMVDLASEGRWVRCGLHPRWNRHATPVCFHAAQEGQRQVCIADVGEVVR